MIDRLMGTHSFRLLSLADANSKYMPNYTYSFHSHYKYNNIFRHALNLLNLMKFKLNLLFGSFGSNFATGT